MHACNGRMFQEFGWPEDLFEEVCIAPNLLKKSVAIVSLPQIRVGNGREI